MEGIKQQIFKLINKSKNILVATPENINGDALGSALALRGALEKINKNAKLLIPEELPPRFQFLPKTNSLSHNHFQEREFVLSIQDPENQINNLYYEKGDGLLYLYFKSKKKIKEKDFRLINSYPFDLIFTINSQSYENLGKAFQHNPELFFETPVVNIDNSLTNDNFGEINLVDVTYSSVSEIIMELIDFLDRNLLDENIATWILAGLIDATENFRSPKTTPRTFNNAALLINRGGDQQRIIRYFYKTKSLEFLRLWGRILRKLSWDQDKKLAWGIVREKDFQKTNTSPNYLPQIFEEIKTAFPEMTSALLTWPDLVAEKSTPSITRGIIYSLKPELLNNLAPLLKGTLKNGNLFFEIRNEDLETATQKILNLIKEEI